MRVVAAALFGAMLSASGTAAAPSEVDPGIRAFVEQWETAARAIKALPPGDDAGTASGCRALTDTAFDFTAMARQAVAEVWNQASDRQRRSLSLALGKRAARSCVQHIGDYGGGAFTLLGVRSAENGGNLATAVVRSTGGRDVHVTWTLVRDESGAWKAADLSANGRSITASFRQEFAAILAANNGNAGAAINLAARR